MNRADDRVEITLPGKCLLVLSGIPACGKSTFAAARFSPTEIVSSDACRAAICDDPLNQSANHDAFDLMHAIISRRMKFGRFCVADATHLTGKSREQLISLCGRYGYAAYLIVFDVPPSECKRRDSRRADHSVGPEVIDRHSERFTCDVDRLRDEGFAEVWVLDPDQVDIANVVRDDAVTEDAVTEDASTRETSCETQTDQP